MLFTNVIATLFIYRCNLIIYAIATLLYIGAKVLQKIEFHKSERKFFAPPYFFGTKVSQVWSS